MKNAQKTKMTNSRRTSRGPVPGRGPAVEKHCFIHPQSMSFLQRKIPNQITVSGIAVCTSKFALPYIKRDDKIF